jgi:hypothetical protein
MNTFVVAVVLVSDVIDVVIGIGVLLIVRCGIQSVLMLFAFLWILIIMMGTMETITTVIFIRYVNVTIIVFKSMK